MSAEGPSGDRRAWAIAALACFVLLAAWLLRGGALGPDVGDADAGELGALATSGAGSGGGSAPDAGRHGGGDAGALATRAPPPLYLGPATVRRDAAALGTIGGRVIGFASGRPVEGATLAFEHAGRTVSATAGEDGRFLFAPPENGEWVLAVASADGFLPFAPAWGQSPLRLTVRAGAHVDGVVITLVDAIEYVVEVRQGPDPIAGAEVRVHGAESGERTLVTIPTTYTTDAAGEARIVAPDGAVVEARHARGTGRGAIDSAAQVTHRVRIALEPEAPPSLRGDRTIAGVVVDRSGAPIADASLVASHESPAGALDRELHPLLFSRGDADGRFSLEGADEGTYTIDASHEAHASARLRAVAAGDGDLRIVLDEGAVLVAHVVDDETGEGLAAATVLVERPLGPLASERVGLEAGYDADGTIEVRGLPPGALRVRAAAPDHATCAPVDVELRAGAPVSLELRLGRGGAIVGRVTSEDGTPLAGARVTLESGLESGASAAPLDRSVLTGEGGSFLLEGIAEGVRSIVVWAPRHHGRLRSGLVVAVGARTDAGTIDLRPVEDGESPRLELAGVGAVLEAQGDVLVIGRVVDGGGAASVGLVAGDAIVAIAGEPVAGLGFEGCIERLRGPEGTTVIVLVRHADGREETLVVPRRRIRA